MKITTFNNLNIESLEHIFYIWNIQQIGTLELAYLLASTVLSINTDYDYLCNRYKKYNSVALKSLLLK